MEKPKLGILKLDPVTQARITNLLDKNNQGTITKRERVELERLVDKAEKISLHNARALVEYRRHKANRTEGTRRLCYSTLAKICGTSILILTLGRFQLLGRTPTGPYGDDFQERLAAHWANLNSMKWMALERRCGNGGIRNDQGANWSLSDALAHPEANSERFEGT